MAVLCDATVVDYYAHVADEVFRSVILCMDEGERDHYLFLHAAFAKCETCLTFWLHHGADLSRGTASHPDWIALEWARASKTSPEILRLLTPSAWPSLRPRAFCAGVELDMYVHVPGRIDRRRISQLASRLRDHQLLLHAAGSLCTVCVRAWLDRGADTSGGTPCAPLKSAFRWAEEAQGDEELLSMLRASAAGRSRSCSGEREGPSEKRPFSCSSVPKVFAIQHWNVCGRVAGGDCFSFFRLLVVRGRRSRSQCCGSSGGSERRLGEAEGHLRVRRLLHFYSASRCGRG